MPTAHDLVRYPALPFPQTHPTALAAFAALFGKPYVPFGASRVLEIGCGGGVNLLSMAIGAPGAEFVGVDLAERPIALARETAEAAGLRNARFHVQDIRDMGAAFGRFDYIIAHGVYAWVPADVRQALMRVAGELLSADGLVFISYNAYPGCHFRQAVRDLLLFATRGLDDPLEQMTAARAALTDQVGIWSDNDLIGRAMLQVGRRILNQPPEVLFHDELTAFYEPQLLSDVVAAADAAGLHYLCDAQPQFCAEAFFPSSKFAAARARAAGDWARFEQLMDFSESTSFRSSIFCRGAVVERQRQAQRLRGLWASGDIRAAEPKPEEPDSFAFVCEEGARITTNNPKAAEFLASVAAAFPNSVPLDAAAEEPGLLQYVLTLFVSNAINIYATPLAFTLTPGERPAASPLVRFQAARGETTVASLRHCSVKLEEAFARVFVTLLDGSRTRADLAREVVAQTGASAQDAPAQVAAALTKLARLGLMAA